MGIIPANYRICPSIRVHMRVQGSRSISHVQIAQSSALSGETNNGLSTASLLTTRAEGGQRSAVSVSRRTVLSRGGEQGVVGCICNWFYNNNYFLHLCIFYRLFFNTFYVFQSLFWTNKNVVSSLNLGERFNFSSQNIWAEKWCSLLNCIVNIWFSAHLQYANRNQQTVYLSIGWIQDMPPLNWCLFSL